MAKGGKRPGAGRKRQGDRVAVLVRIDRDLQARINRLRNGNSMSATVEHLLRIAADNPLSEDEGANRALGFVLAQAANAASWGDLTWRNNRATLDALKQVIPHILDVLVDAKVLSSEPAPHPFFNSREEHARTIFHWIINRLKERGDEYGTDWPKFHPLRNFPKAAAALNVVVPGTEKGGTK